MTHCSHTLDCRLALQATGQQGRERVMQICHGIEYPTNTPRVVHNPNMKSRPLKLAPRRSVDEIPACKWEYWMQE